MPGCLICRALEAAAVAVQVSALAAPWGGAQARVLAEARCGIALSARCKIFHGNAVRKRCLPPPVAVSGRVGLSGRRIPMP